MTIKIVATALLLFFLSSASADERLLSHPKFRRAATQDVATVAPGEFIVSLKEPEFGTNDAAGFATLKSTSDNLCATVASCGGKCSELMVHAMTGFTIKGANDECVLKLLEQNQDFTVHHVSTNKLVSNDQNMPKCNNKLT